jgi:hypothetical protein
MYVSSRVFVRSGERPRARKSLLGCGMVWFAAEADAARVLCLKYIAKGDAERAENMARYVLRVRGSILALTPTLKAEIHAADLL